MAPTAMGAVRPPWLPADPSPSNPITMPNHVYPDTPDAPSLSNQPVGTGLMATPDFVAGSRYYVDTLDSMGGQNGYARVRIAPGDLVEGSAITTTAFDAQQETAASWYGGYVYYQLGGCGWIIGSQLGPPNGTGGNGCASPSRNRTDIGDYWNGTSNCTYSEDGSVNTCDGSPTTLTCNPIPEYANVRPWSSSPAEQGAIRYISNPGQNYAVNWRYKVNGNQYDMVRDTHIPTTDGNWVFVPNSCMASWPNSTAMTNG
jgi:hypothetical protein